MFINSMMTQSLKIISLESLENIGNRTIIIINRKLRYEI